MYNVCICDKLMYYVVKHINCLFLFVKDNIHHTKKVKNSDVVAQTKAPEEYDDKAEATSSVQEVTSNENKGSKNDNKRVLRSRKEKVIYVYYTSIYVIYMYYMLQKILKIYIISHL